MAFTRALAQRLLKFTKFPSQALANGRLSSSSVQPRIPTNPSTPDIAPDPGDKGIFRRFLHKRSLFRPEPRSPSLGDGLVDQLKAIDIARNRIRLDGLVPPPEKSDMAVEDARKLLKAAQLELVKSKLRQIRESCIPYSEFLRICEEYCSNEEQAKRTAKMLDDSAAVIVLGDVVFLRPEEVNTYFPLFLFIFSDSFCSISPYYSRSLFCVGLVSWVLQRVMVEITDMFRIFPFIIPPIHLETAEN